MKFNSQIATSRLQSERLLSLGLKKETADCYWEADLANDCDEHWGKSWEKEKLEKEVDDLLIQMEV